MAGNSNSGKSIAFRMPNMAAGAAVACSKDSVTATPTVPSMAAK